MALIPKEIYFIRKKEKCKADKNLYIYYYK